MRQIDNPDKIITVDDETNTVRWFSEKYGVPVKRILNRIKRVKYGSSKHTMAQIVGKEKFFVYNKGKRPSKKYQAYFAGVMYDMPLKDWLDFLEDKEVVKVNPFTARARLSNIKKTGKSVEQCIGIIPYCEKVEVRKPVLRIEAKKVTKEHKEMLRIQSMMKGLYTKKCNVDGYCGCGI